MTITDDPRAQGRHERLALIEHATAAALDANEQRYQLAARRAAYAFTAISLIGAAVLATIGAP